MGAPSWFSEFFPWVALQGILAYVVAQHPGGLPTMCQTRLVGCVCKCTDHTYALQVAIVTGGNSGIGLETVRALLKKHATVYIAARNAETAKAAIDAFQKDPATAAGKVTFLPLDLGSFRSIEAFVRSFQERESRLDLLFNSGGVYFPEARFSLLLAKANLYQLGRVSTEGYEIHVGINALGHYYLTKLLLPLLRASAKASPENPPRVCFTSSHGHTQAVKGFDPADPSGSHGRGKGLSGGSMAYAYSKMKNILTAYKFHREYDKDGIVFTAVNPGNLRTNIVRSVTGPLRLVANYIVTPLLHYPQEYGAITQLYANTAPETQGDGGAYFVPWARRGEPLPIAKDTTVQDKCTWGEE